jgi:hypothetical protein
MRTRRDRPGVDPVGGVATYTVGAGVGGVAAPDVGQQDRGGGGMTAWITEPGVYDIPAATYHRDPVVGGSLSSSGARKLLPPSSPALFKSWREGVGQEQSDVLDFGRAAHRTVLGAGEDYVVVTGSGKDPNSWRCQADDEAVAAVRAEGKTPIRPKDAETIQAMAAKLRAHAVAGKLFRPGLGVAEQVLVFPRQGVLCRAMIDWRTSTPTGRTLVVDYKTTACAEPAALARSIEKYGYHQQGEFYDSGVEAVGLNNGQAPAFLLVFQEKTPPFEVAVVQPDDDAMTWGMRLNRKAIDVYRHCVETDTWPGYTDVHGKCADTAVLSVGLPAWSARQLEEAWVRGDLDTIDDARSAA